MGLWHHTLCGYGIATSLDYALYSTFATLYDTVGGIGSCAMTLADKEGMIESPCFHGLTVLLACSHP